MGGLKFRFSFRELMPFVLMILIILMVNVINLFPLSRLFPIHLVKVFGCERVNTQEIQDALTPLMAKGFFAADIAQIRARLQEFSWIADSVVRRSWPDQVDIYIIERQAEAKWGQKALVSDKGEIFIPPLDTYPANLPLFQGPPGKQIVMLEHFKNINRILAPLHAKITYLELSSFDTWQMKLNNGISLHMGEKDILTRLEHFVKVYPKIVGEHAGDVDYIDLRYANGCAVKLKMAV